MRAYERAALARSRTCAAPLTPDWLEKGGVHRTDPAPGVGSLGSTSKFRLWARARVRRTGVRTHRATHPKGQKRGVRGVREGSTFEKVS